MQRLSQLLLIVLTLTSVGCEVDMKEGHPMGWTMVLFCILLGVMVVVTPVKREAKSKKRKED